MRTRFPPRIRRRALALALLFAVASAHADDAPGQLPTTANADALAARGIADVRSGDSERERVGVRELVFAGEAGRLAATREVAADGIAFRAQLSLWSAIAAFDTSEAETVLATAASDPRFEVRALAAQGLGGGRSPQGVDLLATLAIDSTPSVRGAALRALFAIDREDAVAARAALPSDPSPELRVRRLKLHRLRGDVHSRVLDLATRAYLTGTTSDERIGGARLLILGRRSTDGLVRRFIVAQYGDWVPLSRFVRILLHAPATDSSRAEARLAAAEALLAELAVGELTPQVRAGLLRIAIHWIAHPARVAHRPVDEEAKALLFAALPDFLHDDAARTALVDDVTKRLRTLDFDSPSDGIRLLSSLGDAAALTALRPLVDPDHVPQAVLTQVSGALRDLRRTGGLDTARVLVDRARTEDIRTDGIKALAGEPWTVVGELAGALLTDASNAVASQTATMLLSRKEPQARALLDTSLLDAHWRPHEQDLLHDLVASADDAAFALLERMMRTGVRAPRAAVFEELGNGPSPLRGPKALALVNLAIATPEPGIDVAAIAKALTLIDGPASVRYVREHWATFPLPAVLMRDLQVVADQAALDFALEIAATTKDDDDAMLGAIATVLLGPAATDTARTDVFWRRLLSKGSSAMRDAAVRALASVDHGPMAVYLVPFLADVQEFATARGAAIEAIATGHEALPLNLMWKIAADRLEDEWLRDACAKALVAAANDDLREKATIWLAECAGESSAVVRPIGEMAGTDAPPERARRLLELLRTAIAARFASPPYSRPLDDDDSSRSLRVQGLALAVARTQHEPTLSGLADVLLDRKFASFQLESRRAFVIDHPSGGGPLTSGSDPLELDITLRIDGASEIDTPKSPLPSEVGEITEALVGSGHDVREGARRIANRLARARDEGTLAFFDDLFVTWTALRIARAASDDTRDKPTIDLAMPLPARPDGAEAKFELDRRSRAAEAAGRYDEAAALAADAMRAGARCGVIDLPPARWIDRGRVPPPSWQAARARVDLLRAAALATAGRADEARALYLAGTRRVPFDPRIRLEAATLRLRGRFDLEAAHADAERAITLARRQGDQPPPNADAMLRAIEAAIQRRGATDNAAPGK